MVSSSVRRLTTTDHDRAAAGMRYVYPVASRRAGGLSIGVNLNPNNACDWRCCYCQVPGLRRGRAPEIDLALLREEFSVMVARALDQAYLEGCLPEGMRRLCDVAISGNGEPTGAPQFAEVVALLLEVMADRGLRDVPLRLISNGSYAGKSYLRKGLALMAAHGGEVWAKVDGGDPEMLRRVNGVSLTVDRLVYQVEWMAALCPTWVQSCMVVAEDGSLPSDAEVAGYLAVLRRLRDCIEGVHLYTPARPSHQRRVGAPTGAWMAALAGKISALGIEVRTAG